VFSGIYCTRVLHTAIYYLVSTLGTFHPTPHSHINTFPISGERLRNKVAQDVEEMTQNEAEELDYAGLNSA
jgi:hypothetical protein